jgi:hypothetical protein
MRIQGAAIVLGAGASKGAQIVGGRTPPLDGEFLDVAAKYFKGKKAQGVGKERVKAWNSFKTHLRSAGLDLSIVKSWRLEQLSTFLEARANLHTMQLSRGQPRDYLQALESLKTLISDPCHEHHGHSAAHGRDEGLAKPEKSSLSATGPRSRRFDTSGKAFLHNQDPYRRLAARFRCNAASEACSYPDL